MSKHDVPFLDVKASIVQLGLRTAYCFNISFTLDMCYDGK